MDPEELYTALKQVLQQVKVSKVVVCVLQKLLVVRGL